MKRAIWLLPVIFILFSLAACTKRASRGKPIIAFEKNEETDDVVLENNYLELRFLTETAEIILTDKVRGTEWRSTPADVLSDRTATVITMEMMRSQFSLQYTDVSGVGETLYSSTSCIEQGNYQWELIDDNLLEVRYTIGNVAKTYIFPPALPESEMRPYLDMMEYGDGRMVEESYRLYDINNLRSSDNKSQLLANYPDLSNEKVYVLRENTPEYMREIIEELFADIGYTRLDYYDDAGRYDVASPDEKAAFNISIQYKLDGKSLIVSVPFNQIAYRMAFPVIRLDLLPFFGAAGINDDGYLFVPDGSGAIVNFNNNKFNQVASNSPIYGWDEAMPRDAVVIDNKASFPAFGMQRNGEALLGIIEEGSSYASVHADVSGRNCSYNRVYPYFVVVHGAVMDISGRSDRAVYLYENGLPQEEGITVRYTICDLDGYVGMAKEYRSWLLKQYPQLGSRDGIRSGGASSVPIAVEIVGAVNKTQHRLGIPFDLPLKLTSYKETESMVRDFAELGWKDIKVKINGWFNRSVDHRVPT
ncbi:MAG: DUF5696 domain-containing protein, partial [Treponema sp.]|nr:DUF5696 domain-containing protein [Treponema sp.]